VLRAVVMGKRVFIDVTSDAEPDVKERPAKRPHVVDLTVTLTSDDLPKLAPMDEGSDCSDTDLNDSAIDESDVSSASDSDAEPEPQPSGTAAYHCAPPPSVVSFPRSARARAILRVLRRCI
jgi:hypothetical protein